MSNEMYRLVAEYYDVWNSDLDYGAWADAIEKTLAEHYPEGVRDILDLGCGSGCMTVELARRGFDMVGVDSSPEMLSEARALAECEGVEPRCLWLLQDMTSFELYGTVEAVVCCLDTLNHLTSYAELRATLALVHNYLAPGGIFLFDLNSKEKFETLYSDKSYTMEKEGMLCVWQSEYSKRTHLADFFVTRFSEEEDGRWRREDALTRERMYPTRRVLSELRRAGFSPLSVGGTPYSEGLVGGEGRLYFAARAEKPNED